LEGDLGLSWFGLARFRGLLFAPGFSPTKYRHIMACLSITGSAA
jgi:hypothetical protein